MTSVEAGRTRRWFCVRLTPRGLGVELVRVRRRRGGMGRGGEACVADAGLGRSNSLLVGDVVVAMFQVWASLDLGRLQRVRLGQILIC